MNSAGPVTAIPRIPHLPFQSRLVRPHLLVFLHPQVAACRIRFKLAQLSQLSQLIQPVRESVCVLESFISVQREVYTTQGVLLVV